MKYVKRCIAADALYVFLSELSNTVFAMAPPATVETNNKPKAIGSLAVLAFERSIKSGKNHAWSGRWVADRDWVNLLSTEPGLEGLTSKVFNSALMNSCKFQLCLEAQCYNDRGIYSNSCKVGIITRQRFYYLSKDGEVPDFKRAKADWEKDFQNKAQV